MLARVGRHRAVAGPPHGPRACWRRGCAPCWTRRPASPRRWRARWPRCSTPTLLPAVPATGNGAAGEIIPLAHLGGVPDRPRRGLDRPACRGRRRAAPRGRAGAVLVRGEGGRRVPAGRARRRRAARRCSAPTTPAAGRAGLAVAAAEVRAACAPRDPYHPALARGDASSAPCTPTLRGWPATSRRRGCCRRRCPSGSPGPRSRTCCAPRPGSTRPSRGRWPGSAPPPRWSTAGFLGTAGFDGFDLAASADAVRLGVLHVAEVGAARLHRMLDPRVTGLPAQLSAGPRTAGRAGGAAQARGRSGARGAAYVGAGVARRRRRRRWGRRTCRASPSRPPSALQGALARPARRDRVRAASPCTRRRCSTTPAARGSERLQMVLHKAFEHLPERADDRPARPATWLRSCMFSA